MGNLSFALAPLAVLQAAGSAQDATPVATEPVYLEEERWRPAASIWSARIGQRAQSYYGYRLIAEGIEGSLAIRFVIGTDGQTRDCSVHTSSGNAELDALGCRALAAGGPAPVLLDEDGKPKEQDIILPFRFVIEDDFVSE